MKITKLVAENIKRLHAVTIAPDPKGNLVIVGGNNGQGKTSLLDSIAMALGGKDAVPAKPIREGEVSAKVVLETEEYVVTRKFTQGGGSLIVTTPDGAKIASPQTLLDSLTAKISFDPLAFTRMKPAEQAETLRRLVGIDFAELEDEKATKYNRRTVINHAVKDQQAEVARLGPMSDAGCEQRDDSALGARMEAGAAVNAANEKRRGELDDLNDGIAATEAKIAAQSSELRDLKRAYEEAELRLIALQQRREESVKERDAAHKEISALVDVDLSKIRQEMDAAHNLAREVLENQERKRQSVRLTALQKEAKELTERLEAIDDEKARTLRKAKFPIEGLSFTGAGVTYNAVPFEQASAAEQLRVSVAMGAAMQPKLKVALIRDGSLLDDNSLKLVAETAEKYGVQVWLERVGEGAECSVIIEDGEVKPTTKTK